jgi:hypothetical protein
MKRIFILFAVLGVSLSGGCVKKEKPAVCIGPVEITAGEFEAAYQQAWGSSATKPGRKEFLDMLVNRKLILMEAEELGMDKDPQFLENLQIFWEQSLMKLVLARKLNELSVVCVVSDKEINDYYERHKESDFPGKELAEARDQIKTLLYRIKQQLELQRWVTGLKKRSKVTFDLELLQIPGDK